MPVYKFKDRKPRFNSTVFIDDGATIVGDVVIDAGSSIWPNAVIRADNSKVRIGKNVNIQDNVVINSKANGHVLIGDNVSVGHGAILHGCEIGNNVLVGMGAIVMDNAKIDNWVLIGAGTIIVQNALIPSKSLVLGIPGKVIKELDEEKICYITENAKEYVELAKQYLKLQSTSKSRSLFE